MKIERLSENQIRCTLNRRDLEERELRISELAYGTEKAKILFRDMMQQASYEVGFEADDIPLMIEAIPVSPETLVLIITKVEEPDELDTRFSKFSPDNEPEEDYYADDYNHDPDNCFDVPEMEYDSLTDLLDKNVTSEEENSRPTESLSEHGTEAPDADEKEFISLPEALGLSVEKKTKENDARPVHPLVKVFIFNSLKEVSDLAEKLVYSYQGDNSLYKNSQTGLYYLIVARCDHTVEEFNRICNRISEYGRQTRTMYASSAYYQEHFTPVLEGRALQVLASL